MNATPEQTVNEAGNVPIDVHAVLDNALDAIIVIDIRGVIRTFNPAAEKLFGYGTSEIIGRNVGILMSKPHRELHDKYISDYLNTGQARIIGIGREITAQRKDGTMFAAELSVSEMHAGGGSMFIGILRDLSERKRIENMMQRIAEGVSAKTGSGFLRALVIHLTRVLDVECALVAEMRNREQPAARTVEVCLHGRIVDNFDRPLDGTPCQAIVESGLCYYESNVQGRFPDDTLLREMAAESYIGVPLVDSEGGVVGFMAALDDKPLEDTELFISIFHLYALRAAAELERKRTEEEIEKRQQRLRVINALLNISIQDVPLHEKLKRALDEILMIPWLPVKQMGCILLAEEGSDKLVMQVQRGLPREIRTACAHVPFGTCICGQAAASKQLVFVDRVDHRHEIRFPGMLPHGHYGVPILMGDRMLGVVNLYLREGYKEDSREREFLKAIVNTLASVIEHGRASEVLQRQATIIDQIHDSVVSTDLNGYVTSWNKGAERLFGYTREEMMERHISEVYLQEDHDFLEDGVIAPLKQKGNHEITVRMRRKSGEIFFAHLSLAMQRDDQGVEVGMIGYSVDITGHKLAQEALRASEGRFRSLVETTSDWIWEVDENGVYTYVSPRVRDLLGYEPQEVMGRTPFDFMPVEEVERVAKIFEPIAARREPFANLENVNRHKCGDLVILETSGVSIFDEHRVFRGYRGIDRDITQRKEAEKKERALLRKNRELTNRLISVQERELRSIARELHDELGQSLTAIRTDATVIANHHRNLPDGTSRSADSIIAVTDHIFDVIHSMLRRLRPTALDDLGLAEALNLLVEEWGRRHPWIPCELELCGELSDLGEAVNITLYRVVQECLTNVLRHAGASRVNLSLVHYVQGDEHRRGEDIVQLVVCDDGRGLDVQKALEDAGNFGLFGIRERIEGLGGELEFDSAPGKGLRVVAILPVRESKGRGKQ